MSLSNTNTNTNTNTNPKAVLGIHDGHNASVCLIRGGRVDYLVQEERLVYEKNFWGFPVRAVADALQRGGLKPGDIDQVSFNATSRVPRTRKLSEALYSFERLLSTSGWLRMVALSWLGTNLPGRAAQSAARRAAYLAEAVPGLQERPIRIFGHHQSHAAGAYFSMRTDPRSEHLVLSLDGAGEHDCATVSVAVDGKLRRIANTPLANSVGSVYAFVTFLMGFIPYEHEYKLMGMAPYCDKKRAEKAAQIFHKYVGLRPDGLGFQRHGLPPHLRVRELVRDLTMQRFDVICAGVQKFTEDLVVAWVRNCIAKTGIRKVCCGGGVFMNVKANKLLMELPEVDYLGVMPSCGDESLSFGQAALGYAELADQADIPPWGPIYFGPGIDDAEAERLLRENGVAFSKPADIELEIAKLLQGGHAVARCRGGMEFGARALGNRSILSDPMQPDCVRVINQMVKKRDFWMPFAPMMLQERQHEYIVNPKKFACPHMMLSFDSQATFPQFIAAVHNADLTARAQILEQSYNPEMYRCLKHFEALTGRGVVLNTSFNLHGYPVCLGPKEALHVFLDSGLKYLALGSFLAAKG